MGKIVGTGVLFIIVIAVDFAHPMRLPPSPGLTRQSIESKTFFAKRMAMLAKLAYDAQRC
jgi:hypothetical protein